MNKVQIINWKKMKSIGAKVLSGRLAKVLNLWIAPLIRCLCNAREHVAKHGEIRPRITNGGNSGDSR